MNLHLEKTFLAANVENYSNNWEDNSFDSLLSPSRACDWINSDPFEGTSSDAENSDEDPRMVRIEPNIIKSRRNKEGWQRKEQNIQRGSSLGDAKLYALKESNTNNNYIRNANETELTHVKTNYVSASNVLESLVPSPTPLLYSPSRINHCCLIIPPPSPLQRSFVPLSHLSPKRHWKHNKVNYLNVTAKLIVC